jgi:hypothetical protein
MLRICSGILFLTLREPQGRQEKDTAETYFDTSTTSAQTSANAMIAVIRVLMLNKDGLRRQYNRSRNVVN